MNALLVIVGGFSSGVFFRSLYPFGWYPIAFTFLVALLFAGARFTAPRLAYALGAAFFVFSGLGMLRAAAADTLLPHPFAAHLNERVSYTGVVVSDPDLRDTTQRTEVRVTDGGTTTILLVVAPRNETVEVGDTVSVSGTLHTPEPFAGDNGRTFRYDKYLARDGVRFILDYAYLGVTDPAPWYSVPATLAHAKHAFLDGLNAVLPEPYSSLAGGIVIGGKSGLGQELQDAFTRTGLVQIIVLSGYNIMVVAEWVMAVLARTKLSRRWAAGAGALVVLLFVGIAGASATALRAMLMAMIALYARATGKSYSAGRALLFVIFLMLVWNPLYLVFDPGFDLSVAATAGLIWLAGGIETWLASEGRKMFGSKLAPRHPRAPLGASGFEQSALKHLSPERAHVGFWINVLATTLAAQLAVLPLLLYFMGNLSLVAIPANMFVAPLVPLAMGLSALAGIVGMTLSAVAPTLAILLSLGAYAANALLIFVAEKAAAFPLAAFSIPAFPFVFVIAAYAALVVIASSKRFSMTDQLRFAKNAST